MDLLRSRLGLINSAACVQPVTDSTISYMTQRVVSFQDSANTWKLSHDFEKDGVPASWGSNTTGPRQWGSEDRNIILSGQPTALAVSPDGVFLAVALTCEIFVYYLATLGLAKILRGHTGHVSQLEFHPHRNVLASSSQLWGYHNEENTRFWDVEQGGSGGVDALIGALFDMSANDFINNRSWSASEVDSVALDMKKGFETIIHKAESQRGIAHGEVLEGRLAGFGAHAFSHDGTSLLYLKERTVVSVYDTIGKRERFSLQGHTDAIMWVRYSPDDKIIASTAWDGTVKLWRSDTGELLQTLSNGGIQSWSGAFSPDGSLIAAGAGDGNVRIWRVHTGELVHTLSTGRVWVRVLDFTTTHYRDDDSDDALYIAVGGSGVRVFDVRNGESVQTWRPDPTDMPMMPEVMNVQYSPDGFGNPVLGLQSPDGRVVLYDGEKNVKWEFEPTTDAPRHYSTHQMVFSPTSRSVICADMDNVIRIWDL